MYNFSYTKLNKRLFFKCSNEDNLQIVCVCVCVYVRVCVSVCMDACVPVTTL